MTARGQLCAAHSKALTPNRRHHYDTWNPNHALRSPRHNALALQNDRGRPVNYFADELDKSRYTPNAIRQLGVR